MIKITSGVFAVAICVLAALTTIEGRAATCGTSSSGVAFWKLRHLHLACTGHAEHHLGSMLRNAGEKVAYSIALSRRIHASQDRSMLSKADELYYTLFIDSARTQTWGDGTGGTLVITDSFYLDQTQTSRHYVIYARIGAGQKTPPAGAYNDTATIILSY